MQKYLCIIGRNASLSINELRAVFGPTNVQGVRNDVVLLEADELPNIERLGGTIKIAQVIAGSEKELSTKTLYPDSDLSGKHTIGVSVYGEGDAKKLQQTVAQNVKKSVSGSVRTVPLLGTPLNSASVIHNKLIKPKALELISVKIDGVQYYGRTIQVQNIKRYEMRDQQRPHRDGKVGMLPPKLAQILINLATGATNKPVKSVADPFCGTGVVLQEAALMGYEVAGSDLSARMVEYTEKNLVWLADRFSVDVIAGSLQVADARNVSWQHSVDAVASELYLGDPLQEHASGAQLKKLQKEGSELVAAALINLAKQLPSGTGLALALPAWIGSNKKTITRLTVVDQLEDLGYTQSSFLRENLSQEPLLYYRDGQYVARDIVVLTRKDKD